MSNRYKGAVISATPPTTTGGSSGTASGAWTLEQQMQLIAAGLWPLPYSPIYVENVFSTWLYTGNGTSTTITNGIDLAGSGGLVWNKPRSSNSPYDYHVLVDTVRGANVRLFSNLTLANSSSSSINTFTSTGFTSSGIDTNTNAATYASWTFREQPKFFDIVTYTGTGSNTTIAHALGSVPGCIIVKRTDTTSDWQVYHRSLANTQYLVLNSTAAVATGTTRWNSTTPTSSVFSVGTDASVNASGGTYVAYIFAHDSGGFGLLGTDNVISCGSYTGNGSATGPVVTLGYEPQWVLIRQATAAGNWLLQDNMRGIATGGDDKTLCPNTDGAEDGTYGNGNWIDLTSTGFEIKTSTGGYNTNGNTYIYIAIRRGPMKVPTVGTSVYSPLLTSTTSGATNTTGFPVDLQMLANRGGSVGLNFVTSDRLRGVSSTSTETGNFLATSATSAESGVYLVTEGWNNTAFLTASVFAGVSYITWNFGRAPSFFDEVCYTGNGVSGRNITHNLTVSPELVIIKSRNRIDDWVVRSSAFPTHGVNGIAYLNSTGAATNAGYSYVPTTTTFQVESNNNQNGSSYTYVAYLFATCAGVSKVGSYTGNGTTQTINCGFTGGARFVLIKRTDATSGWYVYDTVRGMTSVTDPYIFANDGSAQVATLGSVTTVSTGFALDAAVLAAINTNAGTYIFLAIA